MEKFLHVKKGSSIIFALVHLLFCCVVSIIIITSSSVSSGSKVNSDDNQYYMIISILKSFSEDLSNKDIKISRNTDFNTIYNELSKQDIKLLSTLFSSAIIELNNGKEFYEKDFSIYLKNLNYKINCSFKLFGNYSVYIQISEVETPDKDFALAISENISFIPLIIHETDDSIMIEYGKGEIK